MNQRVHRQLFPDVFIDACGSFWENGGSADTRHLVDVPPTNVGVGQVPGGGPVKSDLARHELRPFHVLCLNIGVGKFADQQHHPVLGHGHVDDVVFGAERIGVHTVNERPLHAVAVGEVPQIHRGQIDVGGKNFGEIEGKIQAAQPGVVRRCCVDGDIHQHERRISSTDAVIFSEVRQKYVVRVRGVFLGDRASGDERRSID